MRSEQHWHVPALDGLRGIALIIVMLAHTRPQVFPGGNIGVDLFFVLSGFLITSLLLQEHARDGTISIRQFYWRRAMRLLPALYVFVLAVTIYTAIFKRDEIRTALTAAQAIVLYYYNWWMVADEANAYRVAMFNHLWSLSVEEQFYIVWPFVLKGILRIPRWCAGLVLAGALAFPTVNRMMLWDHGPSLWLYFRTDLRFDALMWGALAPWIIRAGIPTSIRARLPMIGAASMVAFVVLARFNLLSNGFLYLGGYTLIDALAALVIIAAVASGGPLNRILEYPFLRWTGKISYGLYLWHVPIFILCAPLGIPTLKENVIATIATYVVATISFYGFEARFLRMKHRLRRSDANPRSVAVVNP